MDESSIGQSEFEYRQELPIPPEWCLDLIDLETGDPLPNRKQQDKIISASNEWLHNPQASPEEISSVLSQQVTAEERTKFLTQISRGHISDELLAQTSHLWKNQRRIFINSSRTFDEKNSDTWNHMTDKQDQVLKEVYDSMFYKRAQDKTYQYDMALDEDRAAYAMGVLLQWTGTPEGETASGYSIHSVKHFWKRFPNPEDFNESLWYSILKVHPRGFSDRDIKISMSAFRHVMYGKQQEYFDQVKLLKEEARGKDLYHEIEFVDCEANEVQDVANRTEIHGDAFDGEHLTMDYLTEHNLSPVHKTRLVENGKTIETYFSQVYKVRDRFAVVGYVPDERNPGKYTTRTYYLSGSQGVTWRYLPAYDEVNGKIAWFNKGFDEHSIDVPIPFQKALAKISTDQEEYPDLPDPDFVMAGTARKQTTDSYVGAVLAVPEKLVGRFEPTRGYGLVPPQQVEFEDTSQEANFDTLLDSWVQKRPDGTVYRAEVYPSESGLLHMIGVRDMEQNGEREEQVWYGMIENPKSEIGVTGLRRRWFRGGSLFTPIDEYDEQAGGYGAKRMGKHYVSMWENYQSKMPWVKRRAEARK